MTCANCLHAEVILQSRSTCRTIINFLQSQYTGPGAHAQHIDEVNVLLSFILMSTGSSSLLSTCSEPFHWGEHGKIETSEDLACPCHDRAWLTPELRAYLAALLRERHSYKKRIDRSAEEGTARKRARFAPCQAAMNF